MSDSLPLLPECSAPAPAKLPGPARALLGCSKPAASQETSALPCVFLGICKLPGWAARSWLGRRCSQHDNALVEHPGSSHGKSLSLAEDFSRDIAEPAQLLQVHSGGSWVTFWGQGDGKWQGKGPAESREDERRERGEKPQGLSPFYRAPLFLRVLLGTHQLCLGGATSHSGFWSCFFPKPLCEQRRSLCHQLGQRAASGLMSALPNEKFAPYPSF